VFADLNIGSKAPEVESKDLDGKAVKLSQYTGKVVVLDIWATWCGPCRAMIPHTTKLVEKMKDKPFVFVSISADDKVQTVQDFIKKTPMPWTHWYEGVGGKMMQDWEVEYFPTIYILDHKGVIRYKDLRGEKMDEAVEKLVKECEAAKKAKSE
jgi:thiol-disulfide isomerase/thioredoxin